jgi:glycosyltransferase involved in cell wall biosynthesis
MKKVLLVNESSTIKSGYGKYGYHLLSGLRKRGFHVAELAFNQFVNPHNDGHIPWATYYNNVADGDPRKAKFDSDPDNKYGKWRFAKTVMHFMPNYVLTILDPWHCKYILSDGTRRYFNYISMPTSDTYPIKNKWKSHYTSPDAVLCYSDWAAENLSRDWPDFEYNVARYGVNTNELYELDDKDSYRPGIISEDAIIIGYAAKNQPRKMMADVIRLFSKILEKHPDTYLHLHTGFPDNRGWDLPNLLDQYGVANNVLFTYVCNEDCESPEIDLYKGEVRYCSKCMKRSSTVKSGKIQVTEADLCRIYNTWDLYFQGSCSEGAGMPVAEAAACGVPTVVLNTTAMRDFPKTIGSLAIKANETYVFNEQGLRGHICMESGVKELSKLISMGREGLAKLGQDHKKKAIDVYDWDKVVDVWEDAINNTPVINKWQKPKSQMPPLDMDHIAKLPSYDLVNILQDILGINDPYNIIGMCRNTDLKKFGSYSTFIAPQVDRQALLDQIENYHEDINNLEKIRVGELRLKSEDFIKYAEIKEKVHG